VIKKIDKRVYLPAEIVEAVDKEIIDREGVMRALKTLAWFIENRQLPTLTALSEHGKQSPSDANNVKAVLAQALYRLTVGQPNSVDSPFAASMPDSDLQPETEAGPSNRDSRRRRRSNGSENALGD